MHKRKCLIWWMRIRSSENKLKKCKKQLTLLERLSGMKMPISRWLMTLIGTFIAHVAGTQKRYWYRGKKLVYIKFIRPKQASKVSADPDDYDFADEEEYINEDEPEPEEETEDTK